MESDVDCFHYGLGIVLRCKEGIKFGILKLRFCLRKFS